MSTLHDRLGSLRPGQMNGRARLALGNWRPEAGFRIEDMLHAVLGTLTLASSTVLVWAFLTAGFAA